jgi:hypothetical protein
MIWGVCSSFLKKCIVYNGNTVYNVFMSYPDYVSQYRPKGTIVKQVHGTYYVYKATSKRVEGKKYPVHVIEGVIGKIDEHGFHELTKAVVDTTRVRVLECGFTNYLLMFEDLYIVSKNGYTKSLKKSLYRSLIVYLSPNSYLTEDKNSKIRPLDFFVEKMGIGIPNQISAIQRMIGQDLNDIASLKYICLVMMGDRMFESELTEGQKQLIEKLGVDEDDIRRKG